MLRLKKLREQERLSQESLALKLNVSQSTISAYETGERTPDLETFIKIADLFNVSLDYLCGLSLIHICYRKRKPPGRKRPGGFRLWGGAQNEIM